MVSSKLVGLGIMLVAVVFFVLGYAYSLAAEQALLVGHEVDSSGQCHHDPALPCPYVELHKLSVYKHTGLFADLLLFGIGLWLFMQKKPEERALVHAKKAVRGLGGEEAKVFDFIVQPKGMVSKHKFEKHMKVWKSHPVGLDNKVKH